jgi:hypothetical protein
MSGPTVVTPPDVGVFIEEDDVTGDFYTSDAMIGFDNGFLSVEGDFSSEQGDSSDTFLFTAPVEANASVSFTIDSEDDAGFVFLEVYDSAYRSFVGGANGTGSASLELNLGQAQTYLVRVGGSDAEYRLSTAASDTEGDWLITPFQFGGGDALNSLDDVFDQTVPATPGGEESLTVSVGGDNDPADIVRYVAPGSGTATLEALVSGGSGVVGAYGDDGVVLAEALSGPDGRVALEFPVQEGLTYFIRIAPEIAEEGLDVFLRTSFPDSDPSFARDIVNGEVIGDASYNLALAPVIDFSSGDASASGSVGFGADGEDSFRFVAPRDGWVSVFPTGVTAAVFVEIFDSSGESVFSGFDGRELLRIATFLATEGEEFFILTSSAGPTAYDINIDYSQPGQAFQDFGLEEAVINAGGVSRFFREAGNEFAVAATLATDESGQRTVRGSVGFDDSNSANVTDRADYFAIAPSRDGAISLSLDAANEDFRLALYDRGGNLLALDDTSAGVRDVGFENAVSGQLYFIGIEPVGDSDAGFYKLTAQLPAPEALLDAPVLRQAPRSDVGFDAAETFSEATLLELSAAGDALLDGSVGFANDPRDVFVFTPEVSGTSTLRFGADAAELYAEVFHADSFELVTDIYMRPGDMPFNNEFDVEGGETYYITVAPGGGGSPFNYAHNEGPTSYSLVLGTPTQDADLMTSDSINGVEVTNSVNGVDASDVPYGTFESTQDPAFRAAPGFVGLNGAGDGVVSGSIDSDEGRGDFGDTYTFFATHDGTASLLLTGVDAGARIGIFAYDASTFDYKGDAFAGDVQIVEFAVSAGEYYAVDVYGGTSNYTLAIDLDKDGVDFVYSDATGGSLLDADFLLGDDSVIAADDAALYRTYSGMLGRQPDQGGFAYWSDRLESGDFTLEQLATDFLFAPEFLAFFDNATSPDELSSEDLVNHMYLNVFGREPDAGGFDFWNTELESGALSQAQVVVAMTQSDEYVNQTAFSAIDYFLIG